MSSLEQIISDINKEIRIDDDGVGHITIRGAARLVDVDEKAIRNLLSNKTTTADKAYNKFVQMLISKGFETADEQIKEVTDIVLASIIEYYAYEARTYRGQEQARLVFRAFAAIGIRQWIREKTKYNIQLEVTTPYAYVLVGGWTEEREIGKTARVDFCGFLNRIGKPSYSKYTNQMYSALFGCTAGTLRKLRTQSGTSKIARNHLPESSEIRAIQMLEQAVADNYEPGLSITRMIVWYGTIIKAQMHLPHFGTAKKSRSVVWKEMCADDRLMQISLPMTEEETADMLEIEGF